MVTINEYLYILYWRTWILRNDNVWQQICAIMTPYSTLSDDTETILLQLFRPSQHQLEVQIMSTPSQHGATDCGLYAIAIATSLANGMDPSQQIFHQGDMRSHLVDCLSSKKMIPFPIKKNYRIENSMLSSINLYLCPVCGEPDYGEIIMVECEACHNWFHNTCVPPYHENENWYCMKCHPLMNNNST